MTNFEKWRDRIILMLAGTDGGIKRIGVFEGIPRPCKSLPCSECEISNPGYSCWLGLFQWLGNVEHILTKKEKHLLEFLEDGYLTRDSNGILYAHDSKPEKITPEMWEQEFCVATFDGNRFEEDLFTFITSEDKNPWSVKDMLNWK